MGMDALAPQPIGPDLPSGAPTFHDQFEAGIRQENTLGSVASRVPLPTLERPGSSILGTRGAEEFYAYDHLTDEEKVKYGGRFFDARSMKDVEAIRKQIADEEKNKQIMATGPLPEWLIGIGAGVVDPTTYIPVAGALSRGGRIAGTALHLATEAAASTAIQEGFLQGSQATRTTEESVASIFMAMALGAGFGTAAGTLLRHGGSAPIHVPDLMRAAAEADVAAMARSTEFGDRSFRPSDLMTSTSVGRFLDETDRRPIIRGLPEPSRLDLPEPELLAAIHESNPKLFEAVTAASREVGRLQDEIGALEAKGQAFAPEPRLDPVTEARLTQARKEANDPLVPREQREAAAREADTIEASTARERAAVESTNKAIREDLAKLEGHYKAIEEKTLALRDAETALQNHIAQTRAELQAAGEKLGPKFEGANAAKAAADAVEYQNLLVSELEANIASRTWGDVLKWEPRNLPASVKEAPVFANPGPLQTDLTPKVAGEGGSLSAASAIGVDRSKLVGHAKIAPIVAKLRHSHLVAPSLELAASIFRASREVIHRIADTGLITEGHAQGFATDTAMQTIVRRFDAPLNQAAAETRKLYSDYRRAGGPMGMGDFYKEVGFAMRRSDQSNIPQVVEAAKVWRTIEKAMTKEAQDLGLYPKDLDPKTAPSYFTRLYNIEKLKDPIEREKFRDKLAAWLKRIDTEQKAVTPAEYVDWADDIVNNIMGAPHGRMPHTVDSPILKRGPLRERTLLIPDEYIEPWLESNVLTVMSHYVRTLGADIAFYKTFKDGKKGVDEVTAKIKDEANRLMAGQPSVKRAAEPPAGMTRLYRGEGPKTGKPSVQGSALVGRWFTTEEADARGFATKNNGQVYYVDVSPADAKHIIADANKPDRWRIVTQELRGRMKPLETTEVVQLSPAEKRSISDRAGREIQLVYKLVDAVRGTNRHPADPAYRGLVRAGKVVRSLNYMRLLGQVVLSSVPDVGKIVMEEGLTRTLGAVVGDAVTGFKGIRMSLKEAQMAGTAWDMHLSSRLSAIMDVGERYIATSKFERGLDFATHAFGHASLLNEWNTALKAVTSSLAATRILRTAVTAAEGGRISQRDLRKLAQAGITPDLARKIADQRSKFEEHDGGLLLANTRDWTDPQAVEAFRSALLRDVDHTIITPGAADAPLWTSTEFGKSIFQFKRFSSATTQRVLLSGLQARDMQALNGVLLMFAMGVFATYARDIASGKAPDRSTGGWIREGIDRAGLISMFMEADSLFDKATGGHGIAHTLTGEQPSRFAGQDFVERTLGPTAGFLGDLQRATTGAINGDLTQADLHKMRRLLPANNLFYLRQAFDGMEAGIADQFGLPEKQPSRARGARLP